MKKHLSLALLLILTAVSISFAQTNYELRQAFKQKLKTYTREEFRRESENINKRVPNKLSKEFFTNTPSIIKPLDKSNYNKQNKNNPLGAELPANFRIPGEFEEVQAVLITWPYYSVDKENKIPNFLEQLFAGKALYENRQTQEVKLIDINSFPDVFEDSDFGPLFAGLADGIQQEVPVWINIWDGKDSIDIKEYMNERGTPLVNYKFFINQGNSFWYRDCGPVACYSGENDDIGFIDFEYYGGRPLDDEIPVEIANQAGFPVYTNTIEYEGGNIMLDGDGTLFTSTAVSQTNSDNEGKYFIDSTSPYGFSVEEKIPLNITQISDSLTRILNLKNIHILPTLQNDGGTGHIDLYADFFDENTFVFSRMPNEMKNFKDFGIVNENINNMVSLDSRNSKPYIYRNIPFPRKDNGNYYNNRKDYSNYTRTFSNHIMVNKSIIQPVFYNDSTGAKVDNETAIELLKEAYPGYKIIPVDVRSFDGFGGAIHCITKQIPAENPILIYHYPASYSDLTETGFPILAEIHNRSGIEKSMLYWRMKGENEWNEIDMTPLLGDSFDAFIPKTALSDNDEIEYFISAKSNNGKTISKPITAPDGFYTINTKVVSVNENTYSSGKEFYPNPTQNVSTLDIDLSGINSYKLNIIDARGTQIVSKSYDATSGNISIDTKDFANGTYFVNIVLSNGRVINRKLNVIR